MYDEPDYYPGDPDTDSLEAAAADVLDPTDPEQVLHGFPTPVTWPCDWQVQTGTTEFGYITVRECGAPSWFEGKGHRCAAGHVHAGIEAELAPWGLEWECEQMDRAA